MELHPKQFDAYHFRRRFGAAIAGKRSGKTYVGAVWAIKKITEFPKGTGLIAAPTFPLLQQAALDKFFSLFPEYERYYHRQEKVIKLPEGGRVYFRSTDDPLALEGMTLDWVWLDEAGMMKRDVWRIVRARTATTKGQVFITTTPYNMGWLYNEFYIPWKDGKDPDIDVFKWKTIENPGFSEEEYEKEKVRLSPEEFSREYEGEFTRLEGVIWPLEPHNIVPESQQLQNVLRYPDAVVGGIDWGFNHPCGVIVGVVKDAIWYIVESWKESGHTTAEILSKAKEFESKYKVERWFPDPAEPDRIEEMKRAPYHLPVGAVDKSDVKAGLSHVASLIRENRFYIINTCTDLIDEMAQYQFEPNQEGKAGSEKPLKINDDLCDALRYMCNAYRPTDPVALRRVMVSKMQRRTEISRRPYQFS